jgi:hypothetical protein
MTFVVPMACSKKRRAALAFRRTDTEIHRDVDDLAELVDRAVDVPPPTGDLHVGLVDLPAITNSMPTGPGRLG